AGAAVGGIGAYYLAKQNATSNPAELTQSIYSDVNAENQQLDRVTDIFRRLRSCRIATAQGIKTDFQQGRLPRDQASVKLAAVRALYQEDIQFTEALGGRIGERSDGYKFASDELLKTDPNAAQTLAARRAAEPPMPAMGLGGGPVYEANTAANVREAANANAKRVAGLAKGEQVVVLEGGKEWSRIRLANGATGYVSSRLINPPGQAPRPSQQAARPAPTKPPPMDVAGVAQLTESNQLKRRGLESEVATAKSEVASAAFTLEGGGISARPGLPELAEG
ncbi:MAG TPA: SH3 domain-containing protein, partial [Alphaproteobacteria bacterium]|nr:SH3 domain-containing protein [Alphaproteobacteria bacterium]